MISKRNYLLLWLINLSVLSINTLYIPKYPSNKYNTCPVPYFPEQCTCLERENLICEQFYTYTQLDFTRNDDTTRTFESIKLKPATGVKLDETLNLTGIKLGLNALISLSDINSFSYLVNPIKDLYKNEPIPTNLNLELIDSNLEFTYDNVPLNSRCVLQSIDQAKLPFLSSFSYVIFERIKFPPKVCPLIFKDSNITELRLSNLNQNNVLSFISLSNTSRINFNASVKRLEIQESSLTQLDTSLLNKDVFSSLEELKLIDTVLSHIEDDLFESFYNLEIILLNLENFSEFISSSNNTWMSSLRTKGQELLVGLIDSNKLYEYPEEDFCNFITFPHEIAYPYILTKSNLNCSSCSLVWLLQNWKESSNAALIQSSDSVYECLNEKNINEFNARVEECEFNARIKVCLNIVDPVIPEPPEDYTVLIVVIILAVLLAVILPVFVYFAFKHFRQPSGINNEAKLLNKYKDIFFQQDEYDFGLYNSGEHLINSEQSNTDTFRLQTAHGPQLSTRRNVSYTPANSIRPIMIDFEKRNSQITQMLNKRIISQVQPERINGNIQICPVYSFNGKLQVDFTYLNSCTKLSEHDPTNSYLLDENTKERILRSNVFTIFEFNSGAYQIKLDEGSKVKTIFHLEGYGYGYFQFEVMPEGLINSMNTFRRVMQEILAEYLDEFCFVYNGKLIVFSLSEDENFNHLNKVMDALSRNKLKIKKENCKFFQKEIYLFNNLYRDQTETRNVDTHSFVKNNIFEPHNVQRLKKVLSIFELFKSDLDSTQLKLLKGMSEQGTTKLKWDGNSSRAFQGLKNKLLNVLDVDLSNKALRENLILVISFSPSLYACSLHTLNVSNNVSKPVAFYSQNIDNKEINDRSVKDKIECVIWSVSQFESILINKQFSVVFNFHFQNEQYDFKVKNDPLWINKMQAFKFSFVESIELNQELNSMIKIISSA
jgi:hypothetical protein